MLEAIQTLSMALLPVFVVLTMLNVGLTQKPADIAGYWKDWRFTIAMLLTNFLLAPLGWSAYCASSTCRRSPRSPC